jgi:hypothetical protein
MTDPWWTLARWGLATVLGVVAMVMGDPVVRRVFRLAGDSRGATDTPPQEELRPLGPTEDAAAVAAGSDLGEAGPLGIPSPPPAAEPAVTLLEAAGEQLRGGRAIGVLERIGTYATLLSAFPAGIAVIVAIKGLARYPDLKASDGTAERFIVGTFASMLVAAAAAGVAHWFIGLLPGPGG